MDDLVDEIDWFIGAVEHDIADEELDAIVDSVICRDQTDG